MNEITEILRREIARAGVIPFVRFMELALYHPLHGYYERQSKQVGCQGDFITSVSSGRLFGGLLAFQFLRWLEEFPPNAAPRLQLVEAGAHDARLARDILEWVEKHEPLWLKNLDYWILEPSATRQERQRGQLERFLPHVRWFPSWESLQLEGINGIVFSNELLDAFPVHRIGWDARAKRWFEWGAVWQEDRFTWIPIGAGNESLLDAGAPDPRFPSTTPEVLEALPDGFTTETCPAASAWWQQAAGALGRGKLLAIDYGLVADEFLVPWRPEGTLRAYSRHQVSDDLLAKPGEQDLTAHVHFTEIIKAGEAAGLHTDSLQSQSTFLTQILDRATSGGKNFPAWLQASISQFKTLTHPEHFGRSFQVLVQSRG